MLIRKNNKMCQNGWPEHFGKPYMTKRDEHVCLWIWRDETRKSPDLKIECWNNKYTTTNIHLTCPPISLCSWWGTQTLSWCFQDLHYSRNEGGAAWTGWGSRRPGPSCFCHRGVSRDRWALTLTRSDPPGLWAPPNWVLAQTSLFSSARTKRNIRVISFSRMNSLWLWSHQKHRKKGDSHRIGM